MSLQLKDAYKKMRENNRKRKVPANNSASNMSEKCKRKVVQRKSSYQLMLQLMENGELCEICGLPNKFPTNQNKTSSFTDFNEIIIKRKRKLKDKDLMEMEIQEMCDILGISHEKKMKIETYSFYLMAKRSESSNEITDLREETMKNKTRKTCYDPELWEQYVLRMKLQVEENIQTQIEETNEVA